MPEVAGSGRVSFGIKCARAIWLQTRNSKKKDKCVKHYGMGKWIILAMLINLAACGWGSSTQDYLDRATEYMAAEEYESAIIELKNALQQDAQSAEARYRLGSAYLRQGDILSAEKELQRAQRLGWPANDVSPLLAEILLAQEKFQEVADISSAGLPVEGQARVLAAQAQAAAAQGKNEQANKLINRALLTDPSSSAALLARAGLLANQGELEAANEALEAVLTINARHAAAWSLRGDVLTNMRDPAAALSAYEKALEIRPDSYSTLYKRAILYLQSGDFEAAQADADTMLAAAPQHPGANYVQGLLYYEAGEYTEAITALSMAEPQYTKYPMSLFFLAGALLIEQNLDLAEFHAERFHKLAPGSIQGRKLLATVHLQLGRLESVEQLLQPVLDSNPDDVEALNLMANALLRDGKTNQGIAMLEKVAILQPDSPVAQVRLGAGLLMDGQEEDAARQLQAALELNPEFQQAEILLVLNHMRKQDYAAAIKAAQTYQLRHPGSVTSLNLLGKVYEEAGEPEQAREAFGRALALDAGDPAANHNLALMALKEGNLAGARQHYEDILAVHKESVPALIQLAKLDAAEGNETALVERLELAMATEPTALQPRLLLARFYLDKGRADQVAPLFSSLEQQQQQTPEVLQMLAMAQLASGEPEAAQFTLDQLIKVAPDNASMRHMMAMAATGAGDQQRGREELQRALELDENFLASRIALARMALASQAKQELKMHMAKLIELAPEQPEVLLLQAASSQANGEKKKAVAFARQAFEVAPSSATLITLATYMESNGDQEAAIALYENWLETSPGDVSARMALANNLNLTQRFGEAAGHYTIILEAQPENLVALNNQAWIMRETDPRQALEYARTASELAPDSPQVLDTLAVVEYVNRDYERARRSIRRALNAAPDNPSLLYHEAMIAAAMGDETGAVSTLKTLLAQHDDFPESQEARSLLIELSD
jgi:putative PEP-CTERM system TPR-repeat lipoprotein